MRDVPFLLRDPRGNTSLGRGAAHHASAPRRWSVALGWLAGGLALGVATSVIPVIQFFGPIFFPLAGGWMALVTLQRVERARHVRATCPGCGTPLDISGDAPAWPVADDCPACREVLTAEPTQEVEAAN